MIHTVLWLSMMQTAGAGPLSNSLDYTTPAPEQEGAFRIAEYSRLQDRLQYLSKKNNMNATRKIYQKLEALGLPLGHTELLIGAQLHRHDGNVAAAYSCLTQAARIEGTREVIDWLVGIDQQYGRVLLHVMKGFGEGVLPANAVIFPDQKAAIAFANKEIDEKLAFDGFLPHGVYTLNGQSFEVSAGGDVLELSLR
jgi:hypothetical protein